MRQFVGLILVGFIIFSGITKAGHNANAQGPDDTPTVGINPVVREGLELTEIRLAAVRQLEHRSDTNRELIDREILRNSISDMINAQYSPEDAVRDMLFYRAFNLLDSNYTLYEQSIALMQRSITTYYAPEQNTVFVMSDIGNSGILTPLDSVAYGYAYIQNLLNEEFNIYDAHAQALSEGNIDQAMAINALIEGDTQTSLRLYISELIASGDLDVNLLIGTISSQIPIFPSDTPAVLNAELAFPAAAGLPFVQSLYEEADDWRLVDLVYERLPLSTEQILHPHLYLLYEAPHQVRVEPLDELWEELETGHTWTLEFDQTLGEFYLRQHLTGVFAPDVVDEMATGWGGDHFLLYSNEQRDIAMAWRLSWDTPADAEDFRTRYYDFISASLNVTSELYPDGTRCWLGAERSICASELPGDDLLVIQAPTLDIALNMLLFELEHLKTTQIIG